MRRILVLMFACALVASCAGSSDSAMAEQIIGNERLGWDQLADTAEIASSLRFAVHVDGVRFDMQDTSCGTTVGPTGFACSGKLPPMTAGRHSLRLTSISGGSESGQSSPLSVILVSSTSALTVQGSARTGGGTGTRVVTTVDRVRLRLDLVTAGLRDPTDLAVLPDGRLLVAERGGTIRIVRSDRPEGERTSLAATLGDIDLRQAAPGHGGLLALTPDPQFDRTRLVYLVYVSAAGLRLVRFREADDVLVDRAILLDAIAPSSAQSSASLRFGPDAKLYLALDDGGDAVRAGDLGSFTGKVLRLNRDATTPADQPLRTPVYVLDVNAPRGLEWGSTGSPMWIAQRGPDGSRAAELRAVVPAADKPARTRVAMRYLLPAGIEPAQMVMYRGNLIPSFRGELLMAGGDGGGLLRIRFDGSDPLKVVSAERLLDTEEEFRAIATAADGAIYLATSTTVSKVVPDGPVP